MAFNTFLRPPRDVQDSSSAQGLPEVAAPPTCPNGQVPTPATTLTHGRWMSHTQGRHWGQKRCGHGAAVRGQRSTVARACHSPQYDHVDGPPTGVRPPTPTPPGPAPRSSPLGPTGIPHPQLPGDPQLHATGLPTGDKDTSL